MARKKTSKLPTWRAVVLGAILFVGLGVGLLATYKAGANQQVASTMSSNSNATGVQLEAARTAIANQYLAASSTGCTDSSDPIKPTDRVAVFYEYLRVNIHDDRAVIRGCGNHDSLLARIAGKWQMTEVNMSLDTSANPVWQSACDITDITRTDTKVRSENASIDAANLKLCQGLQHGKILQIQNL
jgi:hypothetical protein